MIVGPSRPEAPILAKFQNEGGTQFLPDPFLAADFVHIDLERAPVGFGNVEYFSLEMFDFVIEADAIRVAVVGDGQPVIAIAGLHHGEVAFEHRLNALSRLAFLRLERQVKETHTRKARIILWATARLALRSSTNMSGWRTSTTWKVCSIPLVTQRGRMTSRGTNTMKVVVESAFSTSS